MLRSSCVALTCAWILSSSASWGAAQDAAPAASPEAAARAAARAAKANPGGETPKPGDAKPGEGEKPKEGEQPGGEKKEGDSKEAEVPIIKRSDKFDGPSTAEQINDQVGPDGLVHFNLQGIPWPDVLQWLADASKLSLDWQELPGDYLNLRTQHGYPLEEARDVINRHLLARGFTILKQGELLTVVNLKKPIAGLVPRVEPDELEKLLPHDFVKVSFPLDWMLAKDAVEELKPMLSANGQLTALNSTNRVEAMDAVINLREVRKVLAEEQSGSGQERLVQEFKLKYVRAAEILPLVQKVVGIEDYGNVKGNVSDGTAQQIMQQLQQIQQMQQQAQRNQGGAPGGGGGKSGDDQKPKLVINERENSIVASAPPDKMEIIRQTITALDTPSRREGHLLANPHNLKVHRLSTLDPAPLVTILNELGDLSPDTKLEVDSVNKSLIVYGPLADQITVQALVDKLDGSTRNFQVIPLRRLRAEEVAGTILYMLGEDESKKKNNNSGYYSFYSYRYSEYANQKQEERRPFKVDADIENNRLLLWANEVEREEVEDLLAKMGELPAGRRSNETLRVLDVSGGDADKLLERVRELWPNVAPNKLEFEPPTGPTGSGDRPADPPAEPTAAVSPSSGPVGTVRISASDEPVLTAEAKIPSDEFALIAFNDHSDVAKDSLPPDTPVARTRPEATPPPISIQRGPDGRIIVGSPDTEALDRLEDLLAELQPKRRDFVIFKLKHPQTFAFDVEWNLREFFKTEEDGEPIRDWWGEWVSQKDDSPNRLSKRKPLKIIGDESSRTVLVQGASDDQLRTIQELIDIYDQPEPDNPQMKRVTQMFTVKYSDAHIVAEAIKDAYRDLLSPNDPAFEKKNNEDRGQGNATTITYDYGGRYGNNDKEGEAPPRPEPIRFKGALSMGVDEISNTIVVSAARGLLTDIGIMIEQLDERARQANNVHVIPVDPSINLSALQERMAPVLHVTRPGRNGRNGQQPGNPQPGNGNGQPAGMNNNNLGMTSP